MPAEVQKPAEPSWESAQRLLGGGLLTILMPAYNLAPTIAKNVRHVRDFFHGRIPFEIVAVDDGSGDATGDELSKLEAEIPELRAVRLAKNAGKGGALHRGFEVAKGSFILFIDADLDLSPGSVPNFFRIMEQRKADVVIGSKRHPESVIDYPWHRRLFSATYYFMVKAMFGLPIHDTQTGLKLFRREVLEWVFPRMLVKQFAFDLEILAIAHEKGFRVAEAPVSLDFRGVWGALRPATVRSIFHDTMAVFYRLRLLRYYQSIPDTRIPDPPPLVSIVIAYPAPSAYLDEALAGIARQTYRRLEVILLPDAPSGRVWPEGVREIPTGRRRPAEKRNTGIEQARGEIVVFLDDDAYPVDDWLERAIGYFSIPSAVAVGGPAATPPNDPYMAQVGGLVYANRLVSGGYRYRYVPDRVRRVDDYPSCNLFVRADALRRLGGFRVDFWPGEDTYLCMDLVHKLGKQIFYEPRALVYHHRRKLYLPHLRQVGRYGLHRGYFARRFPVTSRRVSYMLPSLLVAGLAGGAVASCFLHWLRPPYFAAVILYAAGTFLSSAARPLSTWLLSWLGVVLTHLVYGTRFMIGFLSPRLPSEVQRFDHPSEEPKA